MTSDIVVEAQQLIKRQVEELDRGGESRNTFLKLRAAFPTVATPTLTAVVYAAGFSYPRAYNSLVILECDGVVEDVGEFIIDERTLRRLDEDLSGHIQTSYDLARKSIGEQTTRDNGRDVTGSAGAVQGTGLSLQGLFSRLTNTLEGLSQPQREGNEPQRISEIVSENSTRTLGPIEGTGTLRGSGLEKIMGGGSRRRSSQQLVAANDTISQTKLSGLPQDPFKERSRRSQLNKHVTPSPKQTTENPMENCPGTSPRSAMKGDVSFGKGTRGPNPQVPTTPHPTDRGVDQKLAPDNPTLTMKEQEFNSVRSIGNHKENVPSKPECVTYMDQRKFQANVNPPISMSERGNSSNSSRQQPRGRNTPHQKGPASLPPRPKTKNHK